jgi:hypothetical protein
MSKKKVLKHQYNRILEISEDSKQITLPDSRYYQRNGEYYPSITYVLSYYPKGKYFEDWLKKVGYSSEYIVKKASEDGTQVHEMVEDYLNGETLEFLNTAGHPQYSVDVWRMFIRFVDFWETFEPKLIETEVHLFSDEYKVAGTCDLVCEIGGELWVIDLKTSNHLQTTYDLQAAIYAQCYKECFGKNVDRVGILWLKSSKRGPKKDKLQGNGWEIYESSRSQETNLEIFNTVHKLFKIENPKSSPIFTQFRTQAKRKL